MKYFLIALSVLLLSACETTPGETMQGKKVGGQMSAYTKMCLRTPESVLCPQDEFFVTNSKSLNQQWCDLCAMDSSYSWCTYFPECVSEQSEIKQKAEPPQPKGETIQGRAVRVRAQAYEDLCARTPDSVLCSE